MSINFITVNNLNEVITLDFKVTYKTHLIISLLVAIFTILFLNYIYLILLDFYLNTINPYAEKIAYIYESILIISISILVSIAHELLHGLPHKLFGGKVKISFRIAYCSTQEISENSLTLNQFMVVILAPVIIISILSLLIPTWLGSTIFLVNLIGSFGDIYIAFGLLKYPHYSKIVDKDYGYKVIH